MSIVVRFAPQGNTTEQYDQVLRRLEESGNWPADGLEYHVAFGHPVTFGSARFGIRASSGRRSVSASCRS